MKTKNSAAFMFIVFMVFIFVVIISSTLFNKKIVRGDVIPADRTMQIPTLVPRRALDKLVQDVAGLNVKLKRVRGDVKDLKRKNNISVQEKNEARNRATRFLNAKKSLEKDLRELLIKNRNAQRTIARLKKQLAKPAGSARKITTEVGSITSDGEDKFVMIQAGADEGVTVGQKFIVMRGNKFIARISVYQLSKTYAACTILLEKHPVKAKDIATSSLKADLPRIKRRPRKNK